MPSKETFRPTRSDSGRPTNSTGTCGPCGKAAGLLALQGALLTCLKRRQPSNRIEWDWQHTYGNVTVVSRSAPAGVQLALKVTKCFPDFDFAQENAAKTATAGDAVALNDIGRVLGRVRLQVWETAQNPQRT